MIEHFDGLVRLVCRHIDVRPQKLDIVLYLCGHGTLDPSQRLQCIIELVLLEVNAGEPERGFVSYGLIDGAFKHPLDGAPSFVVHAVVELEIADREFGLVDVIVKRIESGFVQTVVLCEFGVEPLDCFEILALVGVIERFVEKEVVLLVRSRLLVPSRFDFAAEAGAAAIARARPSPMMRRVARIDYNSPSVIGVLPASGPATVSSTSFGLTSLWNVKCSVRLKSEPLLSLPSTSTLSLWSPVATLPT